MRRITVSRLPSAVGAIALSLTLILLLAACAVGVDDEARAVTDAPPELFIVPTTEPEELEPEEESFELTLMFIDGDGNRVPVVRGSETRPTIQDVLDGLAGPTATEIAEHPASPISTRLFESLDPKENGVSEGVLEVILASDELRQASVDTPERVRFVYGQIVCSIDRLEGNRVEAVLLVDAEGAIPALSEEVTVLPGAARPSDFRDCVTAEDIALAAEAADEESDDTTDTSTDDS